jgi:HEPN domain-containing protein
MDGSIVLQPAVVLTQQAVESLIKVHEARQSGPPTGRTLSEVLDERGRKELDADLVADVRGDIDRRRSEGARFLSDLTAAERSAIQSE